MIDLYPFQAQSKDALRANMRRGVKRQILCSPTGSGKCHPAGEMVLDFSGRDIPVEIIEPGRRLMGPDSKPRLVTSISSGYGKIVQINPVKGDSWRCNEDHILSLVRTNEVRKYSKDGEIIDVSVREWRKWSQTRKHLYKLFRVGVEFQDFVEPLPLDPYFLGVLLGDGTMANGLVCVTTPDTEIRDEVYRQANAHGMSVRMDNYGGRTPSYRIVKPFAGSQPNAIVEKLRRLGIYEHRAKDKFIPYEYVFAPRKDRLALLAGLLDTDGHLSGGCFEYVSKSINLAHDTAFLARSLGFSAIVSLKRLPGYGTYYRVCMSGNVSLVPTKIPRKCAEPRQQKKSVLRTGFEVEDVGEDHYYGFTLAGDGRYLMSDFTVTHNTEIAMSIVKDATDKGSRTVFIADRQTLVQQTSARFDAAGIPHGVAMGKHTHGRRERVQIASAQTLEKRGFFTTGTPMFGGYAERPVDLVILDECHEVRKNIVARVVKQNITTIGLSATPFTKGLSEYYDAIVNVTTTNALVKDGYLAPTKIIAADSEVNVDGLTLAATGEWVRSELSDRVKVIVGDIVPEWEKQTSRFFGGPVKTIAFCASVSDSEATAERFQESGYDFRVIHYRQSAKEKQEIINRFHADKHIGLISCVALTKGFDAPEVRCLIDAYPLRKSLAMHIQKIGRVMRRSEGKAFGLVIDHAGNWLGFHGATKAFFASGCSDLSDEKLRKIIRQPKKKTDHLKCRECGYILPESTSECPSCGAVRRRRQKVVTVMPGNLEQIDEIDGAGGSFNGDWWEEICAVSTKRCPGDEDKARRMAYAQYRDIFKAWPEGRVFHPVYRRPHPEVALICRRHFQRWLISQKKRNVA